MICTDISFGIHTNCWSVLDHKNDGGKRSKIIVICSTFETCHQMDQTLCESRYDTSFRGPRTLFGSQIFSHPICTKDLDGPHHFSSKTTVCQISLTCRGREWTRQQLVTQEEFKTILHQIFTSKDSRKKKWESQKKENNSHFHVVPVRCTTPVDVISVKKMMYQFW